MRHWSGNTSNSYPMTIAPVEGEEQEKDNRVEKVLVETLLIADHLDRQPKWPVSRTSSVVQHVAIKSGEPPSVVCRILGDGESDVEGVKKVAKGLVPDYAKNREQYAKVLRLLVQYARMKRRGG